MGHVERDDDLTTIINVSTLSFFLSFLPFSLFFFPFPFLLFFLLSFVAPRIKEQREASARRLWRNDIEEDFFSHMVRVEDAKTNESDDGLFALVPEDIIVHRILAELDAISMLRFSLSSKTNFARVFGRGGSGGPNTKIIGVKTSSTTSSSSSSSMMMMRRIKLLTWNVKRDDEHPPLGGVLCEEDFVSTRTTLIARTIRKEKPDVFCTQEETRRMCARLQKETTTTRRDDDDDEENGITYAHFCTTKEEGFNTAERKQMYRELKGDAEVFVALKREEEEDVDAYERAMREGIDCADEHLNNVWWRTDKFELLQGGMFRFRVPENPEMSFAVPMTWVALRTMSTASATTDEKVENNNSIIIACSVHLPAGHDWLEAIPRKVYLAKCVRCAIAELQVTFGADVPIFAMGDFNSQKIQEAVKVLNGQSRRVRVENDDIHRMRKMSSCSSSSSSSSPSPSSFASSRQRAIGFASFANHKRTHADVVDCFEALNEDNPIIWPSEPTVPAVGELSSDFSGTIEYDKVKRVRTGALNGTTWHNWNGPLHSEHISNCMAKQAKHAQVQIGVKNGKGVVRAQATGHERHIDHIYFARGETLRPKIAGDIGPSRTLRLPSIMHPKIRVQKCKVVLDIHDTTLLHREDVVSGLHARAKRRAIAAHQRTLWASDHFPVTATVVLLPFRRGTGRTRGTSRRRFREDATNSSKDFFKEDDEGNRRFRCDTP